MKRALISHDGRLCDIVAPGSEFPVHPSMQWVDAPDDVSHDTHEWNGVAVATKPGPSLAYVKSEKLAELERARNAAESATVTVQGRPFPATEQFQAKVSRALNYVGRGKPLDLTDAWRDGNAAPVAMTAVLLGQIEDAITAQSVAAWKRYWQKFDAVQAATTTEQLAAIIW